MFNSVDIVGSRLELLESVVELLKIVERVVIFANFPIGATIQDGGKRKRSVLYQTCLIAMFDIKPNTNNVN